MAAVEQPMDILVKLTGDLERQYKLTQRQAIFLKGIKDDNVSLNKFLLSFIGTGYGEYSFINFDEYKKLIDSMSMNIETGMIIETCMDKKIEVRTLLKTLFDSSSEQPLNTKIKRLTLLIGEDVRIVLKRCYFKNKAIEYRRISQELDVITKAIESIESIRSCY